MIPFAATSGSSVGFVEQLDHVAHVGPKVGAAHAALQLHHADQMPGSGIHEVAPGALEHLAPGMHPNATNQGVTPEMRTEDRQLHWQMRGEEMGNPPPEHKE